MKFGVLLNINHIPRSDTSVAWKALRTLVTRIENGGWASVWLSDHLGPAWPETAPETHTTLEAWSVLAALAASTSRVRLGTLVSNNVLRHPGVLAEMAATVDLIAGGRVTVGLGAGWHEDEARSHGIPFPSTRERFDRLDEACRLLRLLFDSRTPASFRGTYYELSEGRLGVRPVQTHLPLLVGGAGERRTLPILAQHGDIMNFTVPGMVKGPEQVADKIAVLASCCEAIDRDHTEIARTITTWVRVIEDPEEAEVERGRLMPEVSSDLRRHVLPVGSRREVIEALHRYAAAGVDEVIVFGMAPYFHTADDLERLSVEILPEWQ